MNQRKTGELLKRLRKEKGLTQEQLADHFYISSRTVSRWETGSNMPDVDMLIELADFYDVDIREIIDGERKGEIMDQETKDTLKKVAAYATEGEKQTQTKAAYVALGIGIILLICTILFVGDVRGLLRGHISDYACDFILAFTYGLALALFVAYRQMSWSLEKPSREPERSVMATVVSKEVIRGVHGAGRSDGGYSYVIHFSTEDGQMLEIFAYAVEFGGLKEGAKGVLTHKGRYFVDFKCVS